MKLKKSKIKKLFMLTLPVAAISVVTPIVLTSCGSSSDNTTNTSKVSWVDQTATNITFGPSDKQITGSLTITNGKASLDLNKSVDSTTLEAAIKDDTFKTEISKKVSNPNKVDYKSASNQFSEDKSSGTITVVFGDTNLTISVSNLKVNTPVTQVSWKDQNAEEISFSGIKGNLTIEQGNATLDFYSSISIDNLTKALSATSGQTFGEVISPKINNLGTLKYKESSFLSNNQDKTKGNITVTLDDSKTTLSISVINLKNEISSNIKWKNQTQAEFAFSSIKGNLTISNNQATLDFAQNVNIDTLNNSLNSTSGTKFGDAITTKIDGLGTLKFKSATFTPSGDKKTGVILIELNDDEGNSATLSVNVTNLKVEVLAPVWNKQTTTSSIEFGSDKKVNGNISFNENNANLDLSNKYSEQDLTSAIKDVSFGNEIVKFISKDNSINYKSASFTENNDNKSGIITITFGDSSSETWLLSLSVVNLKVTSSTPTWKDTTESDITFGSVTAKFKASSNAAVLDLEGKTSAYGLSSILNSNESNSFNSVIVKNISNLGSLKIKESSYTINNAKNGGIITITLDDSKTLLTIDVINIRSVTQTFKPTSQTSIVFGTASNQLTVNFIYTSGQSNAEIKFLNPNKISFSQFKTSISDSSKTLFSQLKNYINNNDSLSTEIPTLNIVNGSRPEQAIITYTYVSGNVLTINVDGLKAS